MNLEEKTKKNNNYRKVVDTTKTQQLVLMSLPAGEDIPEEVHSKTTQFIKVEDGEIVVVINGKKKTLKTGYSIVIPPGAKHYVKAKKLSKLYTIYSPPEHPVGLTQKTKPH